MVPKRERTLATRRPELVAARAKVRGRFGLGFLVGMASAVDIAGAMPVERPKLSFKRDDAAALAGDWELVRQDARTACQRLADELETET